MPRKLEHRERVSQATTLSLSRQCFRCFHSNVKPIFRGTTRTGVSFSRKPNHKKKRRKRSVEHTKQTSRDTQANLINVFFFTSARSFVCSVEKKKNKKNGRDKCSRSIYLQSVIVNAYSTRKMIRSDSFPRFVAMFRRFHSKLHVGNAAILFHKNQSSLFDDDYIRRKLKGIGTSSLRQIFGDTWRKQGEKTRD